MVSFTVILRDRRIGIFHASLHSAVQRATGYFEPHGDVNPTELERGLVSIKSLDGTLVASNVWLQLFDDGRGALAADAEIRSPEFWTAVGRR